MSILQAYQAASIKTADNLKTVAQSATMRDLSHLSLPEIDAITRLISEIAPAGNIPGVILSGLARLPGRTPPLQTVRRDIGLLFRGVEQMLDRAIYSTMFAGPAAVIWGYQNLLRLAGKDPEDSFPEGIWQFYVDYALRDDTARHATETHGFDTALRQHHIQISAVDRITAWSMTAIHCLHQYDHLLANEWRERMALALLCRLTSGRPGLNSYTQLYTDWLKQIPYQRGRDAGAEEDYPHYRRRKFDIFLNQTLRDLPADLRAEWQRQLVAAEQNDLPAYQRQMSILGYLSPDAYGETRTPLPIEQINVGLVYRGRYYLLPVCAPGSNRPSGVETVRTQVAALLATLPDGPAASLTGLATCRRSAQAALREHFNPVLLSSLDALRHAPVILNCDPRPLRLPLSLLRQSERGVGDHALTIFDTGETLVFDLSHIFFDGIWGVALAEILTNEALSWAVYLSSLPAAQPAAACPAALKFKFRPAESERIRQALQVTPEAGAETSTVDLKLFAQMRKVFKKRSDLLNLTVNDLLVLYRAIHAVTYRPDARLLEDMEALNATPEEREASAQALRALEEVTRSMPAVLIPVDASQGEPRQRLYPMTFEVPLAELDLLQLHTRTLAALAVYQASGVDEREVAFHNFHDLRRVYLSTLAGFGEVMNKAKQIAASGESFSVGSVKLLAHLPAPLQRLLDQVPDRVELLNDLMKGREVFSNVGAVAPGSTLQRFISAKDDNDKKIFSWGVITDSSGCMHISLRDFRPHVASLQALGRLDLANRITQDYLEAYARGLNAYLRELQQIAIVSREAAL